MKAGASGAAGCGISGAACCDDSGVCAQATTIPPANASIARKIVTGRFSSMKRYFACMTLMSAMRPGAWQIMQVSIVPSAVPRGA